MMLELWLVCSLLRLPLLRRLLALPTCAVLAAWYSVPLSGVCWFLLLGFRTRSTIVASSCFTIFWSGSNMGMEIFPLPPWLCLVSHLGAILLCSLFHLPRLRRCGALTWLGQGRGQPRRPLHNHRRNQVRQRVLTHLTRRPIRLAATVLQWNLMWLWGGGLLRGRGYALTLERILGTAVSLFGIVLCHLSLVVSS